MLKKADVSIGGLNPGINIHFPVSRGQVNVGKWDSKCDLIKPPLELLRNTCDPITFEV